MPTGIIRGLNLLLLAALFAGSVLVYDHLPEIIPMHFGFAGVPDYWVRTSMASWMLLPVVGLALVGFIYLLMRAARDVPEMWNLPEKERIRRLPPEARAPIRAMLNRTTEWTVTLVILLFAVAQVGTYLVATDVEDVIPWYLWVPELAIIAGVLLLGWRLGRRVRRHLRETHPPPST